MLVVAAVVAAAVVAAVVPGLVAAVMAVAIGEGAEGAGRNRTHTIDRTRD